MYILPSKEQDTAIVVSNGRPLTKAIKDYLARIGCAFYYLVAYEYEQPEEKLAVAG